jgi:hypothetical protein
MGSNARPGASLRVWRDYFPNAQIFGADIDRRSLFNEERIRTFYVDQTKSSDIAEMWAQIGVDEIDLIIDDGWHTFDAGRCLFENSIGHLAKHGTYIIEDVGPHELVKFEEFFRSKTFAVTFLNLFRSGMKRSDNSLIVIRQP